MRELYLPLLTVVRDTTYYQVLEEFVRRKVEERIEAKRNSLEGFLTKIVAFLTEERETYEIPFIDIWAKIKEELDIAEPPTKPDRLETDVYGVLTKQKVGRRLREVLGSQIKREWSEGKAMVIHIFNPQKLEKALRRFSLTDLTDLTDSQKAEVHEPPSKSPEKPEIEDHGEMVRALENGKIGNSVRYLKLSEMAEDAQA